MATLINDKVAARSLQQAMEFSHAMDDFFRGMGEKPDKCEELMRYLSRTLLGWGAVPHDPEKAGTVAEGYAIAGEETYVLYMGGVERDDKARRFYLDWAIIREKDEKRMINGGLLFRGDEWSVHT